MNISRISPLAFNGTLVLKSEKAPIINGSRTEYINTFPIDTDDIQEISTTEGFQYSTIKMKDRTSITISNRSNMVDSSCDATPLSKYENYMHRHNILLNSIQTADQLSTKVVCSVDQIEKEISL